MHTRLGVAKIQCALLTFRESFAIFSKYVYMITEVIFRFRWQFSVGEGELFGKNINCSL